MQKIADPFLSRIGDVVVEDNLTLSVTILFG